MREIRIVQTLQIPDEAGKVLPNDFELWLFWSKVKIRGPNDCWDWTGTKLAGGHGQHRVGMQRFLAHRLAFTDTGGQMGGSRVLRHRCNNPGCCNPAHLTPGTQRENVEDAIRAGTFKPVDGRLGAAANRAKAIARRALRPGP